MIGDRESYPDIANHTDCHQQQGAGVDCGEEGEGGDGAQEAGQSPLHARRRLVHLEGKDDQKEQVRDDEVEQQDVCQHRFGVDLNSEGIESQEVGWQAYQEADDVNRENNLAAHRHLHYDPKPKEVNTPIHEVLDTRLFLYRWQWWVISEICLHSACFWYLMNDYEGM